MTKDEFISGIIRHEDIGSYWHGFFSMMRNKPQDIGIKSRGS